MGRGAVNGFSGCSVPNLPCYLFHHIVLCPPHVFELWLGVSKGMLNVRCFCSTKASFLVSNFMKIIRLLQG